MITSPHITEFKPVTENCLLRLMYFPRLDARTEMQAYRQRCPFPPGAWLPAEHRLHSSLCDLGFNPIHRLPEIDEVLSGLAIEPCNLALAPPKSFDPVTMMVARPNRALRAFRSQVGRVLSQRGFHVQGGLRPHVTLAYDAATNARPPVGPDIHIVADELLLIWSQLPPHFAKGRHVVLRRYRADPPRQLDLFV